MRRLHVLKTFSAPDFLDTAVLDRVTDQLDGEPGVEHASWMAKPQA